MDIDQKIKHFLEMMYAHLKVKSHTDLFQCYTSIRYTIQEWCLVLRLQLNESVFN